MGVSKTWQSRAGAPQQSFAKRFLTLFPLV